MAAKRLECHINIHRLHNNHQSAYCTSNSTETALVKVHRDIVKALDNKRMVALILLDLSASIDH